MNNDEYLKLYEDRVKKQGIFHSKEGKIAFSNGLKLSDNPYTETNSELALLWETGWKEAFEARKVCIEETKKNMNKKQRAIIIGGIVAIIIMFLFPPYALYYGGGKFQKGYDVNYFLKPSKERFAIDRGTLSIQYVTVIIIGSLLWILARDTKLKDNLKGDQEKTK